MVSRPGVVQRASRYITYTIETHHKGECRHCGAWRVDGRPPTVHRHKCASGGPDGSQLGPTAVLPTSLQWNHREPPQDEPRPTKLRIPDRPRATDRAPYSHGGRKKHFKGHHE